MKPRRKLKYSKDAITVHWISGHDDIIENEKANEETKRSAGGRDQYSQKRRLPLYLKHTSLPFSTSALKQVQHDITNKRWARLWSKSPHHQHLSKIDLAYSWAPLSS
ncbi:hypothetical protein PAXINDRAFT_20348 [Paxillus involutus ATCC 200175]|uniref:RNase H type-1 domain-containing protein n=1 Tax=Paxillus involutus ATCC 200175 TaxID=664439 RepID=A0A0C9T523_PAXIN|nr:hypothetical protein PAXINDRAFT_20348 [Paxillus involutus ATCC 200175]